jgi:hypothetical protein
MTISLCTFSSAKAARKRASRRDLDPDRLAGARLAPWRSRHDRNRNGSRLFSAAAVTVFTTADGTTAVASQDLMRSLRGQRKSYPDAELVGAYWTSSLADALRIASAVSAPTTIEDAEKRIRTTAAELGIALTAHAMALARAKAALAKLDKALAVAKQTGTLQEFNWRFAFLRCKNPRLNYGMAHNKLKLEIARRIAETSTGAMPDLCGLVDAVLPIK